MLTSWMMEDLDLQFTRCFVFMLVFLFFCK